MLKLYNKEHVAIAALTNLSDYKIEYLLSGEDSLEFSLSIADENIHLVEEEGYIRNETNEYLIKAIDPSQTYKRFSCIVNIESIKGKSIANFDTSNNNITDTIRLAISGTGWILADNNITKRRTVRLKNTNALEVLREIRKVFRVDFRFDAINKIIHVYEKFGEDKGVYFSDELNLVDLKVPSDTYNYATRIIPRGKDGINISSINNGKEYLENFQYSNKIIEVIWEDNRYTDINSLKEDAEFKLNEISKPKRSYQANIADLAKSDNEYEFLDFFLGDTIELLSKTEKFRDKQRIVKYIEYPNEPHRNTCELGNTTLTFEELQEENEAKNNVVNNITSDNGTVDGSKVDSITTEQISDFKASVAEITDLTVVNADITNLKAQNVTITGKLTAIEGEFGTIKANVGVIDKLTVTHTAQINLLEANKASITQLEAVSATIGILEAEVGKIQTLVSGNISSENIQTGGVTSDKLTIANGFITNAMIANLDVSKVNAGDISTNKFRITSASGNMLIADNTLQIRDTNRVRVQIGKDASNDYNMYVWDSTGKLMFDATGLKADGIKNKIIRDDMISDNANISGDKLNINSVITNINNGTTTIKSSKIQLDGTNQTLDVSFNTLKTEVQGIEVGDRNLVKNSHYGENGVTSSAYGFGTKQGIYLKNNTTYTIVANGRTNKPAGVTNDNKYLKVYVYEKNWNYGSWSFDIKETVDTTKSLIFTTGPNIEGKECWINIYYYPSSANSTGNATINWVKLVQGNKTSNDWTPAIEDIDGDINSLKEITTSQSTTIGVMQGQITTAINNTQITKDGQTVLLKDDYNRTVQTVNTMNSTLGSHTTEINEHTGKITGVQNKVNTVERDLNSITQRVSSTESNVTTITSTANTALSNANKGISDAKGALDRANAVKGEAISEAIGVKDTRETNKDPDWYFKNYPKKISKEFKKVSVLGLSTGTTYGILETKTPWIDSSGGYPVQTFLSNNKTYERTGTSNTTWGAWKQIEDVTGSQNKANDALNSANAFTTAEVTTVNNNVAEIKTDVSGINSKVLNLESTTSRLETVTEKRYLNNFSRTGNTIDWIGISSGSAFVSSSVVGKYLNLKSTGNDVQVMSEYFEVDPNMSLKISLMVQNKDPNGSWYFGIFAYDENKTNLGVYMNTSTSLNTNPYFISEGKTTGNANWRTFEGYVYSHNTVVDANTPKGNVSNFFKMHPRTKYLKVRFLNYRSSPNYGNGQPGSVYFAHPTIYSIDSQITNTETRLKTAEQKITDASIISTVSSQFYKKGEADSKYATQSQITQLDNSWTATFKSGYNEGKVTLNANGITVRNSANTTKILEATYEGVTAYGGLFKVTHPQNGDTVLWGRDIVINGGRAVVGTGMTAQSGMQTKKLYLNYSNDFINGVEIGGNITNNGKSLLVDMGKSIAENGYSHMSNGMIIQWGRVGAMRINGGIVATYINFPKAFINRCCSVVVSINSVDGDNNLAVNYTHKVSHFTNGNAYFYSKDVTGKNWGSSMDISYIAIGY